MAMQELLSPAGEGLTSAGRQSSSPKQSKVLLLAGGVPDLAKHAVPLPAPSFPAGNSWPSREGC